jgi:hypothetical protein
MQMRDAKLIGNTEIGVSSPPMLRDADEAEGIQFGDCRPNAMSFDAKFLEILERNRQSTVLSPTMVSMFNLNRSKTRRADRLRTRHAGDSNISTNRHANWPLILLRRTILPSWRLFQTLRFPLTPRPPSREP